MYCYIGGKGSGKSYSCVLNVILPALRQGIPIVTNIPLNADLVRKDFIHADFIVIEDMTQNDIINTPAGTLLIIDEIQLIFGAGITYSKIDDDVLEFFSKSRHKVDKGRSINIVVISQTLEGIAKPVRCLIDTLYSCRKLSVVGASNFYQLKQFEMVGGLIVDKSKPLTTAKGKYSPDVYKYYLSNSQNTDSEVVQINETLVKPKTIFSNRLVQIAFVAPFLLIYSIYSSYQDFFAVDVDHKKSVSPKNINLNIPHDKNILKKPSLKLPSKRIQNALDSIALKERERLSQISKIEKFYGNPIISLNGISLNGQPFFSLESKSKFLSIPSISFSDLKSLGFVVKKLHSDIYLVNDFLVSFPKVSSSDNSIYPFGFLSATASEETQKDKN
jgi:zona occludens toxin